MDAATQAAVDYFAGELPPGAFWSKCGPLDFRVGWDESQFIRIYDESRTLAASLAWLAWEGKSAITRHAYAESQCIAKVREVAREKYGEESLGVSATWGDGIYEVWVHTKKRELAGEMAYDLLAAAHAACLAMEGATP